MSQRITLYQRIVALGLVFFLLLITPILLLNPSHDDYSVIIIWIFLLLAFSVTIMLLVMKYIAKPLTLITESLVEAKKGNLIHHINYNRSDELGQIATYINEITEDFGIATEFVKEIDKGNLQVGFNADNRKNSLVDALENMRSRMFLFTEEEQKRKWGNEGIGIVSELIRKNTSSIKEMGDMILQELVKYLNASQGAIFVAREKDGEQVLVMESCYALNRKKFLKKELGVKEGLVGQAYLEKDFVHVREVPDDYLYIVSGLGETKPHSIIVFPLIENNVTYGVIELASMLAFEPHQISFLKEVSNTLANYIANTLNFIHTQNLLEQSQLQGEKLRAQEEEMRQNMEELEATQEQIQRRQEETEEANTKLKENMDALQLARDEMNQRNQELEKIKQKLEANENVLKKAFKKTKEKENDIREQHKDLEKKQLMIKKQHDELKSKNVYLTDSIKYAQRIQTAILPDDETLANIFAAYFVIFEPKDMVSGDFYWYAEVENRKFIAAVDCTGHGVPGAFMSLIGNSLLNQITKEKHIYDTGKILEYLNEGIIESLKQKSTHNVDGMDVALCCIEEHSNNSVTLHYSGAKCPAYYIDREQKLVRFKPDRRSIGGHQKDNAKPFTKHTAKLSSGDRVFLTTDGLIDSANKNRRRFGSKKLESLLNENVTKSLPEIKDELLAKLQEHTEGSQQRDDITFIGFEIK